MSHITVREYARLTTATVTPSLDQATVSAGAFDALCKLSASFKAGGAALVHVEGRTALKLDNYVGIIETPCGTTLEILPKHTESGDCKMESRALLRKLILNALKLPAREAGPAGLELFDAPLSEWIMQQFLHALDHLIKRGIRFDYQRIEEEQRYLRGQLNTVAQMRQPPGRQHHFQIRHDIFLPDRPENRLLRLVLDQVCTHTRSSDNWRLAHELRGLLQEIPASRDIPGDFRAWRNDRLMAHYQPVKPWCELILNRHMPLAVAGDWRGISLLFPMEKLFERYVEGWLYRHLQPDTKLTTQASREYLCTHDNSNIFCLKPDMLLTRGKTGWIMDAKWKRLDETSRDNTYGLSQGDFYQLFAYGQKYLKGQGDMALIYPSRPDFRKPLPVFDFGGGLRLWVLPFDLDTKTPDAKRLEWPEAAGFPLRRAALTHSSNPGKEQAAAS